MSPFPEMFSENVRFITMKFGVLCSAEMQINLVRYLFRSSPFSTLGTILKSM